MKKYYYEINFYGKGENDYSFYLKSNEKLSVKRIIEKLENEFLDTGHLEQHHIDNIVSFNEINGADFENWSGISQ